MSLMCSQMDCMEAFVIYFLFVYIDTCQTDAKGLSDTTEKSTAPPSRDRCVGVQEDMSTESPAHGDPIRSKCSFVD